MVHACSISLRGTWCHREATGCHRQPNYAQWTSPRARPTVDLSGVSVTDYDMSRDETEVAFTTTDSGGASQIWLAPLDRRTSPRRIADGDQVSFGAHGDLVFRSLEGTTNFPVRIKKDGSGREPVTSAPILEKFGLSPDGEWVTALTGPGEIRLVPLNGGASRKLCPTPCRAVWSSDGRFLYVEIDRGTSAASPGKTLAIPVTRASISGRSSMAADSSRTNRP